MASGLLSIKSRKINPSQPLPMRRHKPRTGTHKYLVRGHDHKATTVGSKPVLVKYHLTLQFVMCI